VNCSVETKQRVQKLKKRNANDTKVRNRCIKAAEEYQITAKMPRRKDFNEEQKHS